MGLGPESLIAEGLAPLFRRLDIGYEIEEIRPGQSHLTEIGSTFEICRAVSQRVYSLRSEGQLSVVLSGNCNIAIGAISGCDSSKTSVVWFDAHGEGNTPETTKSGFLDGMGIAILTGQCWHNLARSIPGFHPLPARRVLLIGSRDVEPEESALLDRVGVLRVAGTSGLQPAIAQVGHGSDGFYLHFDLDVLDPQEATSNQWAPAGGMRLAELLEAVRTIRRQARVKGFGFGSYDPELDANRRALSAVVAITEALVADVN
jgi:arginase